MNVGAYSDGRTVSYDDTTGRFTIGDQAVTSDQVRAAHQAGQLAWQTPDIGLWFESSFPPPHSAAPQSTTDSPRKNRGLAVAIILGALILAAGGVTAALVIRGAGPESDIETQVSAESPELETQASIPSLEFIDPSSLANPYGHMPVGTVLPAGSYEVFLTGDHIRTVQWVEYEEDSSRIDILLKFDDEGASKLEAFTSEHLQQEIPVAIGGKVIFAPLVLEPITGGELLMSGAEDFRQILGPTIVPTP